MLVFKFQLMHSKIFFTLTDRMSKLGSNIEEDFYSIQLDVWQSCKTATHQAEWNKNPCFFISMLQLAKMGIF